MVLPSQQVAEPDERRCVLRVLAQGRSIGLLRFPEARLDLVRAGLIIYGVAPVPSWTDLPGLRPALREIPAHA